MCVREIEREREREREWGRWIYFFPKISKWLSHQPTLYNGQFSPQQIDFVTPVGALKTFQLHSIFAFPYVGFSKLSTVISTNFCRWSQNVSGPLNSTQRHLTPIGLDELAMVSSRSVLTIPSNVHPRPQGPKQRERYRDCKRTPQGPFLHQGRHWSCVRVGGQPWTNYLLETQAKAISPSSIPLAIDLRRIPKRKHWRRRADRAIDFHRLQMMR